MFEKLLASRRNS